MQMTRILQKAALLALCLTLLAACAPEGSPVGVSVLPGDPGAFAVAEDATGPDGAPALTPGAAQDETDIR